MNLRTTLMTVLAGLTLTACDTFFPKNNLEEAVSIGEIRPSERPHIHREYGVFATDDAPVTGPELADEYFDGMRLADCPYHEYSPVTRIRGKEFRIGLLPDGILENGPNRNLTQMLYAAAGSSHSYLERADLRVAIVFTGEEFARQADEALRSTSPETVILNNGQEFRQYQTKAGQFYNTELDSGEQLGILVCGHETLY